MTWYRFAVNRDFGLDPTAQQSGSMGQGDGSQRSSVRRSMDSTRQGESHSIDVGKCESMNNNLFFLIPRLMSYFIVIVIQGCNKKIMFYLSKSRSCKIYYIE